MTRSEIQNRIWRNALSNYFCVGVRLVTGLIMFRLLYQTLSPEEFGFWALLWSVFGYGILLDFGFGFTAQKRVAELSLHQEWKKLSEVLSTVFYSYLMVTMLFFVLGLFGSHWIVRALEITAANQEPFANVLALFLCGLGIAFPLGLFPEMLRGQQRISLANSIFCGGMIANFGLVALGIAWGWSLQAFVVIALSCTFVPDLICGIFALRQMPAVKIQLKHFSKSMIRETMSFSFYAYLITLSTIVLTKTDQLVISSALAVSAVAIYQAGAKMAEVFAGLTQQLPDTFSPAAAHLHAQGDRHMLQRLLVDGTRFSVMLATPFYLIFAFYMDNFLRLLTGEAVPPRETYWVAQVLLFWAYTLVLTQSVSKRVFVMCGHERKLTFLALGEAFLNLALSIGLVLYFKNVLAVAVGSLVASAIFGWCFLWPWAAREANLSGWSLARTVLIPTWTACLPLFGLMLLLRRIPVLSFEQDLASIVSVGSIALVVGAAGLWRWALMPVEREKVAAALSKFFRKQSIV
jgi:O-antigen/teichoic acid export membrane protein